MYDYRHLNGAKKEVQERNWFISVLSNSILRYCRNVFEIIIRYFFPAVKLAKVQKYNRILKQRRAKKVAVREYDLVNKFFDKIKVVVFV